MIQIRQHGDNDELFDIKQFFEDIEMFFNVDKWLVEIEWCSAVNAIAIQNETKGIKEYSNSSFKKLYSGITQTIDGRFELRDNNITIIKLLAFDSSFWEIESSNISFEEHMLTKYGAYNAA